MKYAALVLLFSSAAHAQAPCIPKFLAAEEVKVDATSVKYCDDGTKCFVVDTATGKATAKPRTPPGESAPRVEIEGKVAKACKLDGTGCKTFKPKTRVDEGLGMTGNASNKYVALINLGQIETFDLATGKRLAGFKSGKGMCATVAFVAEDILYIENYDCGTQGEKPGQHWLATPKGKKIAAVQDAFSHVVVDNAIATVSSKGDSVVVQEIKTGKVVKKYSLPGAAAETRPVIEGDAKRLAVVFGGDRSGDIAVIDLATDKVTQHAATRCK